MEASGLAFVAAEQGIEGATGIWAYLFLTAGRGLSAPAAGLAVTAYGATMLAGRVGLGPVAERLGAGRVLGTAVAGVVAGAALLALPGPGAVAGVLLIGLAAAPVFPLFMLTTGDRLSGGAGTARAVSLQVAASAAGGVLLPAGLGLLIGAAGPGVVAPGLLLPAALLGAVGALLARAGRPGGRDGR